MLLTAACPQIKAREHQPPSPSSSGAGHQLVLPSASDISDRPSVS